MGGKGGEGRGRGGGGGYRVNGRKACFFFYDEYDLRGQNMSEGGRQQRCRGCCDWNCDACAIATAIAREGHHLQGDADGHDASNVELLQHEQNLQERG